MKRDARLGVEDPDALVCRLHHAAELLLALAKLSLDSPLLGDVALCSPGSNKAAVLDEANEAIQEDFGIAVAIELVRFHLIQAVAAPDEAAEEFDVVRVGLREKIAEPGADDLRRGRKPIHPSHGVVTLSEVAKAVHILDLLIFRQVGFDGLGHLAPPDALGTLLDERSIPLLAPQECLLR